MTRHRDYSQRPQRAPTVTREDFDSVTGQYEAYRDQRSRITDAEHLITGMVEREKAIAVQVANMRGEIVETRKDVGSLIRITDGLQTSVGQILEKLSARAKSDERRSDHRIRWFQIFVTTILSFASAWIIYKLRGSL